MNEIKNIQLTIKNKEKDQIECHMIDISNNNIKYTKNQFDDIQYNMDKTNYLVIAYNDNDLKYCLYKFCCTCITFFILYMILLCIRDRTI
jgi:hypothetical protein